METSFTSEQLADPAMAYSEWELRACLQCGYCMDICPTYQMLDNEYDSPRGRVFLIKEMLEGGAEPDRQTVDHIDRCLYCLACMSSCPSSVHYMHLMDHARAYIEDHYRRPILDRGLRWMIGQLLPYPDRLRLAMRGARLVKPLAGVMPEKLGAMVRSSPRSLPPPSPNDQPQIFPALGERKRRVALLTGCAQKVLNTSINDATIRILRRHGCEVVVAQGMGCCGALTHHMGRARDSRAAAARNIRAWMMEVKGDGLDAVVVNTSGCGTMVKDYDHLFRNDVLAEDAATIASLTRDISELLTDIELHYRVEPDLRVAYHATCSLQFGQRIRFTPKKLLKAAGFTVLEPKNKHLCCGFAGTYSMLQPEMSEKLKTQKVKTLERGSPDAIVAGNIGCMVQIGSGTRLPVVHTVELLDWVTGGPRPGALDGIEKRAVEG